MTYALRAPNIQGSTAAAPDSADPGTGPHGEAANPGFAPGKPSPLAQAVSNEWKQRKPMDASYAKGKNREAHLTILRLIFCKTLL